MTIMETSNIYINMSVCLNMLHAFQAWILLITVPGCICIVGEPTDQPQPSYAVIKFSDWLQCGGVLVARDLVATTASCVVRPFGKKSLFTVTLGAVVRTKQESRQQHFKVVDIVIHEKYVRNIVGDGTSDIALLRLDREATIVPGVVEVVPRISSSLQEDAVWEEGQTECTINGYGLTHYGDAGSYSRVRRAISLTGASREECSETIYPATFQTAEPNNFKKQLCSLSLSKTTCVGDEGSPLICPYGNNSSILVGLVQYSTCQKSSVTMYTRLFRFSDWIKQYMT